MPRRLALTALLLAACSGDLDHDSPFDPQSDPSIQARGTVTGFVRLQGEQDHSSIAVHLSSAVRDYTALTLKDGSFVLQGVVPGNYALVADTRNYTPVTTGVLVDIAGASVVPDLTLVPVTGRVRGSVAVAPAGGVAYSPAGILVSAHRIASPHGLSQAPGRAAASGEAEPGQTLGMTGADGSFAFDLPAGGYVLRFERDGLPTQTSERIDVTADSLEVEMDPLTIRPITGYASFLSPVLSTQVPLANTDQVDLYFVAYNADFVEVADDPTFTVTTRFAITPVKAVTLVGGDGLKTVYVRFADADGNYSPIVSASVRLDTEAPAGTSVSAAVSSGYTQSVSVTLQLACDEPATTRIVVSNDDVFNEPEQGFSPVITHLISGGDGPKTVWVRFTDPAGNASVASTATFTLDTTPPPLPALATQSSYTQSSSFNVTLANDNPKITEGASFSSYQVVGADYPQWTSLAGVGYPPSFTFNLAADGEYRLSVRAADKAGNVSGEAAISVVRDTAAPAAPSNFKAEAGNAFVDLSWTPSTSPDVVGYKIYYGELPAMVATFANEGPSPIAIGLASTFRLTRMPNGTSVVVGVTAVDRVGLESGLVSTTVLTNDMTPVVKTELFLGMNPGFDWSEGNYLAYANNTVRVYDATRLLMNPPPLRAQLNASLFSGRLDWPYLYGSDASGLRVWNLGKAGYPVLATYAAASYAKLQVTSATVTALNSTGLSLYPRNADGTLGAPRSTAVTSGNSVHCLSQRCYVGGFHKIQVFTNNAALTSEAQTTLVYSGYDIVAVHRNTDDLLFVAAGGEGLRIMSYTPGATTTTWRSLGSYALSNATAIAVQGSFAYVTAGSDSFSNTLYIFDVSDLSRPKLLGQMGGVLGRLAVQGHYLMTTTYQYLKIFELSRPMLLAPQYVYSAQGHPNTFRHLSLEGTNLVGGGYDSWTLLDAHDAASPAPLQFNAANVGNLKLRDDVLYTASGGGSTSGNITAFAWSGTGQRQLSKVSYVGTGAPGRVLASGMYLFAADYQRGLRVYDARNAGALSEIAECLPTGVNTCTAGTNTAPAGISIAKNGDTVFLGDNRNSGRMWAISVTTPSAPRPVTWVTGTGNDALCAGGRRVIHATYGGTNLYEYDEAQGTFTLLTSFPVTTRTYGCAFTGNYVYLGLKTGNVKVYDATDVSNLILLADYQAAGEAWDLIPAGNLLYIGAYGNGIVTTRIEP